jgi:hypothetical protein
MVEPAEKRRLNNCRLSERGNSRQEERRMDQEPENTQKSRRTFLKGIAVLGSFPALLMIGKGAVTDCLAESRPTMPSGKRPRGYHMTPHIKKYYEKAGL